MNYKEVDKNESYKYLFSNLNLSKNKDNFKSIKEFSELMAKLHNKNIPFLFQILSLQDPENVNEHIPFIYEGSLVYSKKYFENPDSINEYKKLIKEKLNNYIDRDDETINKMIDSIIKFEKKLYEISMER